MRASAKPSRRSNYKRFFGDIAKWVVEIDDAARIPELVTRAFAVATSGRPGPVVISLPEDMLTIASRGARGAALHAGRDLAGRSRDATSSTSLLGSAKRPFVILGGTRWSAEAVAACESAAEAWALPVGVLLPPPDAVRPSPP